MKRYFELSNEKSNKFWEIRLKNSQLITRYGKIGSDGKENFKSFSSSEEAQKKMDSLIKEKIGKGYVEHGIAADSNPAEDWAKDYFSRFEKMVSQLQDHELVQNVCFNKAEPLSEESLQKVQSTLGYQLSDYICEFYKQSNGLQLHWNSYAALPEVDSSKNGELLHSIDDFRRGDDKADAVEGWVCLYPFETFIENYGFDLSANPYQEELNSNNYCEDSEDIQIKNLDNFNFYCQTCFPVNGSSDPSLLHHEDYGACISKMNLCNFVSYMEYISASYGYVHARLRSLGGIDDNLAKVPVSELPMYIKNRLAPEHSSINAIIKHHYPNKGCEYLDNIGGLGALTKALPAQLKDKLFAVLELEDWELEEMEEE